MNASRFMKSLVYSGLALILTVLAVVFQSGIRTVGGLEERVFPRGQLSLYPGGCAGGNRAVQSGGLYPPPLSAVSGRFPVSAGRGDGRDDRRHGIVCQLRRIGKSLRRHGLSGGQLGDGFDGGGAYGLF